MSTLSAILQNEGRLATKIPIVIVMILIMPLIVTSILRSTMQASLEAAGFAGVSGAEQVVPGQALLFGFFISAAIGLSFFRDHGWNTWYRLRASSAQSWQIVVGKTLPWAVVGLVQLLLLFIVGSLLFDLDLPGPSGLLGLVIVSVGWVATVCAFGVAIVALVSGIQMINTAANLGSLLFSSLGGAIVPSAQLPAWARWVGRATPTHWAMDGYQGILIEDQGWSSALAPTAVLFGFALVFGLIAVRRFRIDDVKSFWA